MRRTHALALVLALSCASCEKPPAGPAARANGQPPEPSTAPLPAGAGDAARTDAGGRTRYACDDGSALGVRYVADRVEVELPDGRTVSLPKAQSASTDDSEAFVGEALALQREGDGIELHRDEQPTLRCRATGR